ncbi:hypothetical protein BDV96DRAFT_589691 [Lophiotrema nucula]|uniref:Uncharacterized protein n=1 Tax=Lophiotrema nucula TaxID=690887 RepID=A0A6A5YJD9_9PLEO|nr:hypothetical protein BDV96DRAFT_589691 [Lophiotrema nucula]
MFSKSLLLMTLLSALTLAAPNKVSPMEPRQSPACFPGGYRCNKGNIEVCNSSSNWQLSAVCSSRGCSTVGGSPHCL